jgi:hypothetical protein
MTALRVCLAVLVGYLVVVILVMAATATTTAAFGVTMTSVPPPRYLVTNVLAGMVAAAVGGFVCARLAPAGRVTITVGLLFAVFLILGVVSGRAAASTTQPLWYQAVVTLLGASGLLIGVVIERSQEAERARRTAR